jgi:hypothetical protein
MLTVDLPGTGLQWLNLVRGEFVIAANENINQQFAWIAQADPDPILYLQDNDSNIPFVVRDGRVGLGSQTGEALEAMVHVISDGPTGLRVDEGSAKLQVSPSGVGLVSTTGSPLPLLVNNTEVARLTTSGIRTTGTVTATDGTRTTVLGSDFIGTTSAHNFRILSNNSERIRVGSSGLVGIGAPPPNIPLANLDVRSSNAGQVVQIIQGATAQTADLTNWRDSFGTVLASVTAAGGLTGRSLVVSSAAPNVAAAEFFGTTGQTAHLTRWRQVDGTTVAAVTPEGQIGVGTAPVSNSTLHVRMPGNRQGFVITNGDSVGNQTWFGFTTGPGPLGTNNDEFVQFLKDPNGWVWNSTKSGTGTVRAVRWLVDWVERFRMNTTGISFFGATPAAQQTGGSATASNTYGATEQTMLQKAYDALRTFGFLT